MINFISLKQKKIYMKKERKQKKDGIATIVTEENPTEFVKVKGTEH